MAVVNCGGISNVTFITGEADVDLLGFDTGPGNVLIDRIMRVRTAGLELMDRDGKYGLVGQVSDLFIS